MGLWAGDGVLGETASVSASFILCCRGAVELFSEGIVPHVAVDLVCPVGEGEFRVFLHYHLEPPPFLFLLLIF